MTTQPRILVGLLPDASPKQPTTFAVAAPTQDAPCGRVHGFGFGEEEIVARWEPGRLTGLPRDEIGFRGGVRPRRMARTAWAGS